MYIYIYRLLLLRFVFRPRRLGELEKVEKKLKRSLNAPRKLATA